MAEELGIEHGDWFTNTVKKYQIEIEQEFGLLRFQNGVIKGKGQPVKFCFLTEDQATYLMTLSRNTDQVRRAKRNLVKAFSQAKEKLRIPQTYIESLKALLAAEEDRLLLEEKNKQLAQDKKELISDIETLSEMVDELFDYSSIIRVAKFNNVSEKNFNWRKLKQASEIKGDEIKKEPCPRYGSKNLYSHSAWMLAYPEVKLPETTTLIIKR